MNVRIAQSKRILIVPDQRLDVDLVAATFSLAKALQNNGKEVKILINDNNYPVFISQIILPGNLRFIEPEKPKDYIITLENQNAKVKEVKWEQVEGKINIIVTTEQGDIDGTQTNVKEINAAYDMTFLVGFTDPVKAGSFYEQNKTNFEWNKLVIINHTKAEDKVWFNYTSEGAASLSEIVKKYLEEYKIEYDADCANDLLTGIYWKTNNFRENIGQGHILKEANELVEKGANATKAALRANRNIKFIETKLISEALRNVKITKDNIASSKVSKEVVNNTKLDELIFEDWNIIANISKVEAAYVIVEGKDENTVFLKSNSSKINPSKVVKEYNGKGDKVRASFKTNKNSESIDMELNHKLTVLLAGNDKPTQSETKENVRFESIQPTQPRVQPQQQTNNNVNTPNIQTNKVPGQVPFKENQTNIQQKTLQNNQVQPLQYAAPDLNKPVAKAVQDPQPKVFNQPQPVNPEWKPFVPEFKSSLVTKPANSQQQNQSNNQNVKQNNQVNNTKPNFSNNQFNPTLNTNPAPANTTEDILNTPIITPAGGNGPV